jgi:hypothetical protein
VCPSRQRSHTKEAARTSDLPPPPNKAPGHFPHTTKQRGADIPVCGKALFNVGAHSPCVQVAQSTCSPVTPIRQADLQIRNRHQDLQPLAADRSKIRRRRECPHTFAPRIPKICVMRRIPAKNPPHQNTPATLCHGPRGDPYRSALRIRPDGRIRRIALRHERTQTPPPADRPSGVRVAATGPARHFRRFEVHNHLLYKRFRKKVGNTRSLLSRGTRRRRAEKRTPGGKPWQQINPTIRATTQSFTSPKPPRPGGVPSPPPSKACGNPNPTCDGVPPTAIARTVVPGNPQAPHGSRALFTPKSPSVQVVPRGPRKRIIGGTAVLRPGETGSGPVVPRVSKAVCTWHSVKHAGVKS